MPCCCWPGIGISGGRYLERGHAQRPIRECKQPVSTPAAALHSFLCHNTATLVAPLLAFPPQPPQVVYPEECKDARPECVEWAVSVRPNPAFMLLLHWNE